MKNTDGDWDALRKERVECREGEVSSKPRDDAEMLEGLNLDGRIGSVATFENLFDVIIITLDGVRSEELSDHRAR